MNKDRRIRIGHIIELLQKALEGLRGVQSEEESVYNNFPENLQGSQRYEDTEQAIDTIEDAVSSIESAIESLEEV